jgi:hypothetical protein
MHNCQCWQHRGLNYTDCHQCAIQTSKVEHNSRQKCLLPCFVKLLCTYIQLKSLRFSLSLYKHSHARGFCNWGDEKCTQTFSLETSSKEITLDTQAYRQTDTQAPRHAYRQRHMHPGTQTDRQTETPAPRHTASQPDRQTDRQRHRHPGIQTDRRPPDRQTQTDTQTETDTDRQTDSVNKHVRNRFSKHLHRLFSQATSGTSFKKLKINANYSISAHTATITHVIWSNLLTASLQ